MAPRVEGEKAIPEKTVESAWGSDRPLMTRQMTSAVQARRKARDSGTSPLWVRKLILRLITLAPESFTEKPCY